MIVSENHYLNKILDVHPLWGNLVFSLFILIDVYLALAGLFLSRIANFISPKSKNMFLRTWPNPVAVLQTALSLIQ